MEASRICSTHLIGGRSNAQESIRANGPMVLVLMLACAAAEEPDAGVVDDPATQSPAGEAQPMESRTTDSSPASQPGPASPDAPVSTPGTALASPGNSGEPPEPGRADETTRAAGIPDVAKPSPPAPGPTGAEASELAQATPTPAPPQPTAPPPSPTPFRSTAETDRETLVALYEATGGGNWNNTDNWLTDAPLGDWHGVTTDGDRVAELDLAGNGLSGEIPEVLWRLERLEKLYLEDNNLAGEIPARLGGMRQLTELFLAGNQLTGCVPVNLVEVPVDNADYGSLEPCHNPDRAALAALYHATGGPDWVDSANWLTEEPLSQWTGVRVDGAGRVISLGLGRNRLRGELPAELGDLEYLIGLGLGNRVDSAQLRRLRRQPLDSLEEIEDLNWFSGGLPPALSKLPNLEGLGLPLCGLEAPLPAWLGDMKSLRGLDLSFNEVEGPIPAAFGGMESLESLNLRGMDLPGPIPPELGNLQNLRYLELSQNNFNSPIPPELGNMKSLTTLRIFESSLTGTIPPELDGLEAIAGSEAAVGSLIGLSQNNLTGEIPRELGNLTGLEHLNLGRNQLTGKIPRQLGQLNYLAELNLSDNQLTGQIPSQLADNERLRFLTLNDNQLTGEIPAEFTEKYLSLYLAGNQLTGCIPRNAEYRIEDKGLLGLEECG